uniref:RanBP2-type domain-containing protein n=1 Tax=Kalanchoe fedtschenkoi TaxID=63787 RepID=A0A7N0ZVL1_KALFE
MEGRRGGRASRGLLPFLALHAVNEYHRLERKPPVTAALLAANTLIYLRPEFLEAHLPTLDEVAFNPYLIVKHKDLKRFLLSAFYHVGESHLVYNMMSLLWKGIQLETSMGSTEFASMIAALLGLSQGINLLMAKALLFFFDYDKPYYSEFAVGFSGVLFAMKVVLNSQSDDYTYVHGMILPAKYAAWAELILIQMLVPNVSFLGHLGGILAGLIYLQLRDSNSASNPIAYVFRGITGAVTWPMRFLGNLFQLRRSRGFGRGTVGQRQTRRSAEIWRCIACTFDNSGYGMVCEMCGTRRGGGVPPSVPSYHSGDQDLSVDEIRRRRLERFNR